MSDIFKLLSQSIANNSINSEIIILSESFISDPSSIRYPSVVYTDAFLDNPVSFSSSIQFYDLTIIPQLPSGSSLYERDLAQFLNVTTNDTTDDPQFLPVLSKTYITSRNKFSENINHKFTELAVNSALVYFKD